MGNVIVLGFDAATGNLLREIQYTSGPQTAEHGASVAVDDGGRIYVAGGHGGDDGSDVLSGGLRRRGHPSVAQDLGRHGVGPVFAGRRGRGPPRSRRATRSCS